jgi:hypothetical protein
MSMRALDRLLGRSAIDVLEILEDVRVGARHSRRSGGINRGSLGPLIDGPNRSGRQGVSRREEWHLPALAEPGVNVSAHRAPIVQPSGCTPNRQ